MLINKKTQGTLQDTLQYNTGITAGKLELNNYVVIDTHLQSQLAGQKTTYDYLIKFGITPASKQLIIEQLCLCRMTIEEKQQIIKAMQFKNEKEATYFNDDTHFADFIVCKAMQDNQFKLLCDMLKEFGHSDKSDCIEYIVNNNKLLIKNKQDSTTEQSETNHSKKSTTKTEKNSPAKSSDKRYSKEALMQNPYLYSMLIASVGLFPYSHIVKANDVFGYPQNTSKYAMIRNIISDDKLEEYANTFLCRIIQDDRGVSFRNFNTLIKTSESYRRLKDQPRIFPQKALDKKLLSQIAEICKNLEDHDVTAILYGLQLDNLKLCDFNNKYFIATLINEIANEDKMDHFVYFLDTIGKLNLYNKIKDLKK